MNFERYLGITWKTGGREVSTGLDCWGLLRYFYANELGISLAEYAIHATLSPSGVVTATELDSHKWIETDSPRDGDAVALGKVSGFSHVGVFVSMPAPGLLHIAFDSPSCIVSLKALRRKGFNRVKFYRHA